MAQTKTPTKKTAKKPAAAKAGKSPSRSAATKAGKASNAKSAKAKATKKPAAKAAAGKPAKRRSAGEELVTIDRRAGADRREESAAESEAPKLERREKVNRRRQIDPTTCERDYSDQEVEFMNAMDEYKRRSGRMFPTCSEVLEVIRDLGYVRLTPAEAAMISAERGDTAAEPTLEDSAQQDAEQALAESEALRAD
ncbi:hypothetical protein [Botrimarina sp.]|uniref:hypothetical protein n=1 Tax=Botrimarina sp. TaxID=2795802 RepID=UPI0032EBE8CC